MANPDDTGGPQGAAADPANFRAEGPAFSPVVKALASGLVLSLLYWAVRGGGGLMAAQWTVGNAGFAVAVLAVIALGYYWIMVSRTSVDATHIRQTWMWHKEVLLSEITQAKFIYVPYLAWLVAPRLVVRVAGQGFFVFHAAHPAVLRAFARISLGMPVA